jgi:hypothetical protein
MSNILIAISKGLGAQYRVTYREVHEGRMFAKIFGPLVITERRSSRAS